MDCPVLDFHQGRTVFKHWLPGVCYRDITFQLVSEARAFQKTLVTRSNITHTPLSHRTGQSHTHPGTSTVPLAVSSC